MATKPAPIAEVRHQPLATSTLMPCQITRWQARGYR